MTQSKPCNSISEIKKKKQKKQHSRNSESISELEDKIIEMTHSQYYTEKQIIKKLK